MRTRLVKAGTATNVTSDGRMRNVASGHVCTYAYVHGYLCLTAVHRRLCLPHALQGSG